MLGWWLYLSMRILRLLEDCRSVLLLLVLLPTYYSSVPIKHAAHLLILQKFSLPTRSNWSYTFIKFLEMLLPTRLFRPKQLK